MSPTTVFQTTDVSLSEKTEKTTDLEALLNSLLVDLEKHLAILRQPQHQTQLKQGLHHDTHLPEVALANVGARITDFLGELDLMFEPPALTLADHFFAYISTKCLCTAVEMNIPDVLNKGPMSVSKVAHTVHARSDRLRQIMRVLCNNGIFAYNRDTDEYSNTPPSVLLQKDHWTQWHNWIDLYGNEFYDMARGIPGSCKEGETRMPGQVNFDSDLDMFTFFDRQGWMPRLHKTLSGGAIAQAPGILEDYQWSEIEDCKVLDIGGGQGGFIASLLRKHLKMRGAVLDIQNVIGRARLAFHDENGEYKDLAKRVLPEDLIVGDFLTSLPPFEVYTMKWCLHNWPDEQATQILRNARQALVQSEKCRFIILESLIRDGRSGRLSRYGDITMMVSAANGCERDADGWNRVATKAGWRIHEIHVLRNAWVVAIDLRPV